MTERNLPELPEPTDLRQQVCSKCGYVGPMTTTGVHIKPGSDIACNYWGNSIAFGYTADQMRAYARAAIEQSRAWLPIESAPKDGTEIILNRGLRVGASAWVEWPDSMFGDNCWTIGKDGESWDGDNAPTRWMPLPPAPDAAGGGK